MSPRRGIPNRALSLLRESLDLKGVEMAARLGLRPSTVSALEHGHIKLSVKGFMRHARQLGARRAACGEALTLASRVADAAAAREPSLARRLARLTGRLIDAKLPAVRAALAVRQARARAGALWQVIK